MAALEARGKVEVVRLAPTAGTDLRKWRRSELAQASRTMDLVGVHSFLSAFPWKGPGKRVQTLHELPWKHGVTENADWRHKLAARFGAAKADAVITATEFTARDIGRKKHGEGGNLFVVPWGVDDRFEDEPPPGVVDETLLPRYSLGEGAFVLALGATRAKKNLGAILAGLAHMKASAPKLVVTGPDTQDLRRDLGLAQKLGVTRYVSTPGQLEEEHLPGLLRLASAVIVLSKSEGFGLPVLEALACGTPVIVPMESAQTEVAGPDAFRVNPDDPASVAAGLSEAIERREELRYVLADHARAFTWDRTAEGIEAVWEAIA